MAHLALIVDDDAPTRFVYTRVLSSLGFETAEAGDGDEAVQFLADYKPSFVLLDLLLPGKSGFEVLDAIYADPLLDGCHIIVISAQNRREPALRPGDYFLLKPVLPQQIRDMVKAFNFL
ncbi:MAG: response regulator [bacterium]|nr:response regulator [bacterium]